MEYKNKHLYLSIAIAIGIISPASASLVDTGRVFPSNSSTQHSGAGQMNVGFSGGDGTFEVNTSSAGNGFTSANASGLIIGNKGTTGTVRVIGNGTSGSAQINISTGVGLRNSSGGTGILEITNGGVIHSAERVYLGNQGLANTAGTATTLVDGNGSILRTQQSSTGQVWERDGGRIYVGFDGQSNSTVNITNGGLMEALSGNAGDTGDDGSIWIGTGDSGSTATVNVSGVESTLKADTYMEIGARDSNTSSNLNIINGGHVEVTNSTSSREMTISTIAGEAKVTVNASSLNAENIQIGGKTAVLGFTSSGLPTTSADFNSMVEGQQVSDANGNLVFDRAGNPVLAVTKVFSGGFETLVPETFTDENRIYVKNTGSLIVENYATVNAQTIDVSTNEPTALPYNGQGATLTVRNGGDVLGDVNINKDGILNGDGGTISGNVLVDGGTIAPGNSPGTLFIDGNLTFNSGLLEIEIGSTNAGEFDILHIVGDLIADNGYDLSISFLNGYMPEDGDILDFLQIDGASNVDLSLVNLIADESTTGFDFSLDLQGGVLSVVTTSAVPVPASVWFMGTGLFGLIGISRRNKNYCTA